MEKINKTKGRGKSAMAKGKIKKKVLKRKEEG